MSDPGKPPRAPQVNVKNFKHHPGARAEGLRDVAADRADPVWSEAAEDQIAVDRNKAALKGIALSGNYDISNVPRPLNTRKSGGKTMPKTRRNKSSGGDIVSHLLTIRNQVKLYHWQTGSFARHKATDDLTAALDLNIDAFVESYMGRYGRPKVSGSIKLHNFSESAAKSFVAKETKYLETELPRKIGKGDSDLLNLRDTILGDLTKVSYLFTLQ